MASHIDLTPRAKAVLRAIAESQPVTIAALEEAIGECAMERGELEIEALIDCSAGVRLTSYGASRRDLLSHADEAESTAVDSACGQCGSRCGAASSSLKFDLRPVLADRETAGERP